MNATEEILFWTTVLLLGGGFFFSAQSLVYRKPRSYGLAHVLLSIALVTLTALGAVRWIRSGHPPFVTLFESMLTGVWFLILFYTVLRRRVAGGKSLLPPVAGIALLLMGWSSSLPHGASPLSVALDNVWLFVHATFATCGAATFLIGASLSTVYLLGEERMERFGGVVTRIPARTQLPHTIERALLFGLVLWGIMIASGAIWAHAAWGRYWAWDPIELWSLISWLLYGALFHARLAFRLSQRAFCWLTIAAAATVVFSLWGIQYVYDTIHTYG